jgi:hypothetical protein
MLKAAALVLLSLPVLVMGLLASSSCVIVDVKQADGPRIIVPVPLMIARTALHFAPREATHIEVPELAEYSDLGKRLVSELRDAPDGILVEVEDRNDHVTIEKVGDELEVEVHDDEDDVSVRVPLALAAQVFESYDGKTLRVAEVVGALSKVSSTNLVHVKSRDEEVRVWIW